MQLVLIGSCVQVCFTQATIVEVMECSCFKSRIQESVQKIVCEQLLSVPAHAFPRAWLEPPRSQRARHCGVSRLTLILRESAPALQATESSIYKANSRIGPDAGILIVLINVKCLGGINMSQVNKKSTLMREIVILVPIFIVIYFGVILLKYLSNDDLTWLSTFVLMFSTGTIIFIVSRIKKKSVKE